MNIDDVFAKFPKQRPRLPEAYQAIYDDFYYRNREGQYATTSLSRKLESWLHLKVAEDVRKSGAKNTLEIGAGTLNQLKYEPEGARYDVVEPFVKLYENSPYRNRVDTFYADISEIPPGKQYDRILSVATFEHITNLPEVVARAALLLKSGGTLRTSIPNEGKWPWRLGTMVTGAEFSARYHLNYQVIMRHEHVNTADEIESILDYFFAKNHHSVFGLNKTLALYRFYESYEPKVNRAQEFLARLH